MLVAERGTTFVGFVAGWIEEAESIAETPDSARFGYVSDICVMSALRGRWVAAQLLRGFNDIFAVQAWVRLRINSLR